MAKRRCSWSMTATPRSRCSTSRARSIRTIRPTSSNLPTAPGGRARATACGAMPTTTPTGTSLPRTGSPTIMADILYERAHKGKFDRIVLVAGRTFLGELRQQAAQGGARQGGGRGRQDPDQPHDRGDREDPEGRAGPVPARWTEARDRQDRRGVRGEGCGRPFRVGGCARQALRALGRWARSGATQRESGT